VVALCGSRPAQALLMEGRLAEARIAFWEEAEDADRNEDSVTLAEAAIGLGGVWVHEHRSTLERARVESLQRRALDAVDPSDPLACRLRARLAAERAYVTGDDTTVTAELDVARHLADPVALAEVLSVAHHCSLGPADAAKRLALADELIQTASLTGRPVDAMMGLAWRTVDLFLAGDRRAARSLREVRDRLAVQRCDAVAFLVAAMDVMVAMRIGDLVAAERLAEECSRLGAEVGDADAEGWYGAQLLAIRWLQGRSAELLPFVRELDQATTVVESNDSFAAATASVAAAAGDLGLARAALAGIRSRGLCTSAGSSCWLATLTAVADAAHTVGDVTIAAEVYGLLAPFAHLPVMASLGVACFGSAHHPLGLAASTLGDLDLAAAHFEAAMVADLEIGNAPCHAIAAAQLAETLGRRGLPGDVERAGMLWASAIAAADRLGLTGRARGWREHNVPASTVTCARDGAAWTVGAAGRHATVAHSVGMDYLAALIAHPGVEIAAVELVSRVAVSRTECQQFVLDDATKAAYRRRVDDLRAEIDDADDCADIARSSNARYELDLLLEELRRATGLGGRTRGFGHASERARVSVRKAIMRALDSVRAADAAIAAELGCRVVTGARCVFLDRAQRREVA
jgi:hypothetical protein